LEGLSALISDFGKFDPKGKNNKALWLRISIVL